MFRFRFKETKEVKKSELQKQADAWMKEQLKTRTMEDITKDLDKPVSKEIAAKKDADAFKEYEAAAFQEDPHEALEGSIKLAQFLGVEEDKILHNKDEIDEYFHRS